MSWLSVHNVISLMLLAASHATGYYDINQVTETDHSIPFELSHTICIDNWGPSITRGTHGAAWPQWIWQTDRPIDGFLYLKAQATNSPWTEHIVWYIRIRMTRVYVDWNVYNICSARKASNTNSPSNIIVFFFLQTNTSININTDGCKGAYNAKT